MAAVVKMSPNIPGLDLSMLDEDILIQLPTNLFCMDEELHSLLSLDEDMRFELLEQDLRS